MLNFKADLGGDIQARTLIEARARNQQIMRCWTSEGQEVAGSFVIRVCIYICMYLCLVYYTLYILKHIRISGGWWLPVYIHMCVLCLVY